MRFNLLRLVTSWLLVIALWPQYPHQQIAVNGSRLQMPVSKACCCPTGQCQMTACPGNSAAKTGRPGFASCLLSPCSHGATASTSVSVPLSILPGRAIRAFAFPEIKIRRDFIGAGDVVNHASPLDQPPRFA